MYLNLKQKLIQHFVNFSLLILTALFFLKQLLKVSDLNLLNNFDKFLKNTSWPANFRKAEKNRVATFFEKKFTSRSQMIEMIFFFRTEMPRFCNKKVFDPRNKDSTVLIWYFLMN